MTQANSYFDHENAEFSTFQVRNIRNHHVFPLRALLGFGAGNAQLLVLALQDSNFGRFFDSQIDLICWGKPQRVPQWLEVIEHGISMDFSSWEAAFNSLVKGICVLLTIFTDQSRSVTHLQWNHPFLPLDSQDAHLLPLKIPRILCSQVAITNCCTSLIAGCVTFPVLGRAWWILADGRWNPLAYGISIGEIRPSMELEYPAGWNTWMS